ncbi:MAG TPA: hypothetical protein VLC28_03000 [Flavitalea sp.]|nr:hypothetical protein [Flavitalea sp.]
MVENNLDVVRAKVEKLHYAVMKISGKHFLKSNRLLVETDKMDESGTLWLTTKDPLPKILINSNGFNVHLRYVNKDEEKYLQIEGRAFIEQYSETVTADPGQDKVTFKNQKNIMIRVQMANAEYFKKRTISKYTSFLQSVWTLSMARLIHPTHFGSRNKIA